MRATELIIVLNLWKAYKITTNPPKMCNRCGRIYDKGNKQLKEAVDMKRAVRRMLLKYGVNKP